MGRPRKNRDLGEGIGTEAVGAVPATPEPEGRVTLTDISSFVGKEIGGKKVITHSTSGGVHIIMDADGAAFTLTDDEVKHYVKE